MKILDRCKPISDKMKQSEKEKVQKILSQYKIEASFLENNEGVRNGLIKAEIVHESDTIPNNCVKKMLENGYVVSCVCGSMQSDMNTTVYFEELQGTFY